MSAEKLIVALDTTDLGRASAWAAATAPHVGLFKLGLEFFLANGAAGVRAIAGRPVFLDLKLHDIPNTVAGGVRAALGPSARFVVPGIRPAGSDVGDQARVMTPAEAVAAGANWIVVGRPITGAVDPGAAAATIAGSFP